MGSTPHEVVISGISGKFPNCRNVEEFKEKLFAGEMMLIPDENRWNPGERDKPYMTGKNPDVDKFDISFFGVSNRLAMFADPVMGSTLEVSTEAMIDAGINPYSMKGRNVSVIAASSLTDAEILRNYETRFPDGQQATVGLARTMLANRLSHAFNFHGPSYNVDSSWVSAVQSLEVAATAVGQGGVEAALVTCVNLTFHNSLEQEYMDIDEDLISQTDKCSPFDAKADGFLRSEGTVSFFIQRAQNAKRNYCTILNTQTRCLHGLPGSFTSINPLVETFIRNFYEETQINPNNVSYVEAFGFCCKDRDAQELNAVANVLCEKRQSPLMIGCGTGNYGNSETASSFMSLTKAIIALDEGVIPPTINYTSPNPRVPGLKNDQLNPVTQSTSLPGPLVAVNALNISGSVAHTLLRQNSKCKTFLSNKELPKDGMPRLCILQARNEEGANAIAQKVASRPLDPEFVSLVNDVFKVPIPQYLWRAYSVFPGLDGNAIMEFKELNSEKRPVWLVFSGMGSQWPGMGRDLLALPEFATAIDRCDQCLRPLGVDIKHVLTSDDPTLFDNILNCFVGITAMQIGLVNCVHALGLKVDGMIGHSTGETCCAYADGCITLEETILASYYRGKASLESQATKGMMAAVGLGHEAIKDDMPATVDVACHNAADNCTISGPVDDVVAYVQHLQRKKVFAKLVNAAGIAYHSRYIKCVGPPLKKYLKKLIKSPKFRSSRWISTSFPESQWDTEEARLCSADYLTHNLLNPVYFEEGCKHMPKNAIILEVSPHGLLQSILRRSFGNESIILSLSNKTVDSNLHFFLTTIGKLHLNNEEVDANALFPRVQYPVSRGTPPLSTLVTWDHYETRLVEFRASIKTIIESNKSEMEIAVSAKNSEFELWQDHRVDDLVVLPLMQLLTYPWRMIFSAKGLKMGTHSIVLEDVVITGHVSIEKIGMQQNGVLSITSIGTMDKLKPSHERNSMLFSSSIDSKKVLLVTTTPASFLFEVSLKDEKVIVTGKLSEAKVQNLSVPTMQRDSDSIDKLNSIEIYNMLSRHGYKLGPQFQVIKQIIIHNNECVAKVKWTADVVVFVDALFKFLTLLRIEEEPFSWHSPSSFLKLVINNPLLANLPFGTIVTVHYDRRVNRLVCEFAELLGTTFKSSPHKSNDSLVWRESQFSPYFEANLSCDDFLRASLHIARGTNLRSWKKIPPPLHILLIKPEENEQIVSYKCLEKILLDCSQLYELMSEINMESAINLLQTPKQQSYLVISDLKTTATIAESISTDALYCISAIKDQQDIVPHLRPINLYDHQGERFALLKKIDNRSPVVVSVEGEDWLKTLRSKVQDCGSSQPFVLVTRMLRPRQILPILAAEPYASLLRIVFMPQINGPKLSSTSPAFSSYIPLGLPVNILSGGVWGYLRSVDLYIDPNNDLDCFFNRVDSGIEIDYVGLNPPPFNQNCNIDLKRLRCLDFSGRTEGGKESVMGVAQLDSESNCVRLDDVLRWPVPSTWSLLDAATVPVTYGLAYYCVEMIAKVDEGETVLVHGTSPMAEAIICMALRAGANIITSVDKSVEKRWLQERFPKLNPKHIIINSEDLDIPVKMLTQGKGVQVAVNCSSGREMQSLVKTLGPYSRFLHLTPLTVEDKEKIGMFVFISCASFYGITMENLLNCSADEKNQIQRAVLDGIMRKDVKPLKRKTFSTHRQSEVLEFLKNKNEGCKTILCRKESTVRKRIKFNPQDFVVIAGTSKNLWVDVASWVVNNGGRNFIVLTTEPIMGTSNNYRINRLMSYHKATFTLCPLSSFDSLQDGIEVFEDFLKLGSIDCIICINMDEGSKKMRNLDLASRKILPKLRHFVSFLGEGTGVSESRALSGLPVCCVQTATPLDNPANLVPCLRTLLSHESSSSRFFIVEDSRKIHTQSDTTLSLSEVQEHLPHSVDELEYLGSIMSETEMREVSSLSPRLEHVKHMLLPFFVIPGISSVRIRHLTRQLMHPVFCPLLPPSLPTIQSAVYLKQQIVNVQDKGPYNVIADTWSGVVALHLASLLEAEGHQVVLFMLEASPSSCQARAKLFCRPSGVLAAHEFFTCVLGSKETLPKEIDEILSWDEQLDLLVKHLRSTLPKSHQAFEGIRKYLTVLKCRLTDIMNYSPPNLKNKVNIHLIQTKEYKDSELSKKCQQKPVLHIMEDVILRDLINNPKTAAIINENAVFTWKF